MLYAGCHLSASGGNVEMIKTAQQIGANTFAFFTRNPRGSKAKPEDPKDCEAAVALLQKEKFGPLVAHGAYTMNVCTADPEARAFAAGVLADDLRRMAALPGNYYNFHPGCHVGQGVENGIRMVGEMLNTILWPEMQTMVLIETMAGKGTELGRDFGEIRQLLEQVDPALASHVGVCLDTCHVQDSGYKLETEDDGTSNVDKVLELFDREIGLDRLCAIHMNDTRNPCGTRKDRHDKLGEGYIGPDAFRKLLNHPKLRYLPFYLETPNEIEGYTKEIAMAKSWYIE